MAKWIFLLSEFFILLIVFWTARWDGKQKQQRSFSITLPDEAFKDSSLLAIQVTFQRQLKAGFIVLLGLICLSLFVNFKYFTFEMLYFFLLLFAMILLPWIFYGLANQKVRRLKLTKGWEAGQFSHGIHEDDFWLYGQFYINPHDISRSVTKRMGLGTTLNLAHKSSKRLFFGMLLATLIITFGLTVSLYYMESKIPEFRIENQTLYVDYPIYYTQISLDEIVGLTVLQSLPAISKENGISTAEFARGYYAAEGYGRVFMCIYNEGPYIAIETKQGTLIVNESTSEKTYTLLEALDIVIPK